MERMGRATTHLCVASDEVNSARQMVHTKKVRKMKIRLRCSMLLNSSQPLLRKMVQGTEERVADNVLVHMHMDTDAGDSDTD